MTTNLRTRNLLAILLVGGLGACTTQAATGGSGGSGGAGATTGSGGTTTGSGGATTGSGGAGGGSAYPVSQGVNCLPPATSGLITDFTYVRGDAATPVTDQVHFGDDSTTLSGGEFVYPNTGATPVPMYPLTSDVTGNTWHITGTVGDYSGFGFFFDSCNRVNATGFKGISFTISGTVMGQALTFEVDTLNDTIKPAWLSAHGGSPGATDPGACDPGGTATTTQYSQTVCTEPTKSVTVGSSPTTVTVLWSDFTTGKPDASPAPADIVGIRWVLPTPTGAGTASAVTYSVDLTVDNIAFVAQ